MLSTVSDSLPELPYMKNLTWGLPTVALCPLILTLKAYVHWTKCQETHKTDAIPLKKPRPSFPTIFLELFGPDRLFPFVSSPTDLPINTVNQIKHMNETFSAELTAHLCKTNCLLISWDDLCKFPQSKLMVRGYFPEWTIHLQAKPTQLHISFYSSSRPIIPWHIVSLWAQLTSFLSCTTHLM